mmetsp:Transcript_113505/g.315745  ORF Transcript_113505/g.315745 Transcript_113505/m.315745 type:complete len:369 (-) Transcript_113505:285-1391(-)
MCPSRRTRCSCRTRWPSSCGRQTSACRSKRARSAWRPSALASTSEGSLACTLSTSGAWTRTRRSSPATATSTSTSSATSSAPSARPQSTSWSAWTALPARARARRMMRATPRARPPRRRQPPPLPSSAAATGPQPRTSLSQQPLRWRSCRLRPRPPAQRRWRLCRRPALSSHSSPRVRHLSRRCRPPRMSSAARRRPLKTPLSCTTLCEPCRRGGPRSRAPSPTWCRCCSTSRATRRCSATLRRRPRARRSSRPPRLPQRKSSSRLRQRRQEQHRHRRHRRRRLRPWPPSMQHPRRRPRQRSCHQRLRSAAPPRSAGRRLRAPATRLPRHRRRLGGPSPLPPLTNRGGPRRPRRPRVGAGCPTRRRRS